MKRVLACLLLLCLLPQGAVGEGLIRLHILAPGDALEDQKLKMAVREKVLSAIAGLGDGDALASLNRLTPLICEAARQAGYEGKLTLETGYFYFDQRSLEGRIFPAGFYPAARLIMGEGRGRNWWGLLNPDLTEAAVPAGEITWHLPRLLSLWLLAP